MRSIVIIDPDADSARVTKAGLERGAPDGSVAIAPSANWPLPGDGRPDLVIIDPAPPHLLRGLRLIQRLREDSPATRVMILASAATPALRAVLQELGVDAYLEKPAAMPGILECIRRMDGEER